MNKFAINDFISTRNRSGSSRGADLIVSAIEQSGKVTRLRPHAPPRFRLLRLLNMLWWDLVLAPWKAQRAGASTIIHTTNVGGRGFTRGLKSIVVVHDVHPIDYPRLYDRGFQRYFLYAVALSVRLSDIVVVPSNYTRSRLLSLWPKAKVRVIPWYIESRPEPSVGFSERELTILCVASLDMHKRIPLAIEAVHLARRKSGRSLKLMIVGRPGNDLDRISIARQKVDPGGDWSAMLEGVSESELRTFYRTSLALIVPSLDEGFCLPVIEAGVYGTPVIHTGRGAVPEVLGDEHLFLGPSQETFFLSSQIVDCLREGEWNRRSAQSLRAAQSFDRGSFTEKWTSLLVELED